MQIEITGWKDQLNKIEIKLDNIQKMLNNLPVNQSPQSPEYLSRQQAADFLNVSKSTISNLARSGQLRKYIVNRNVRYKKDDLIKIIES